MAATKPEGRILRARLAAYSQHAQGRTNTSAARAALERKFELEVDPDGLLSGPERTRRAEFARKAYYTRLALKSAQARRARTT
jgi:hypothetical protein